MSESRLPAFYLFQARNLMSSGGTPPTYKAIVKGARRLFRGKAITGSWRSWPHEKPIGNKEEAKQ
jgi:hypothetical protein